MAKRVSSSVLNKIIKEQESQERDLSEKIKELKKLGKRANERLKDLENSKKSEKSFAYNNAMNYFNKIGREGKSVKGSSGKPRFKYAKGKMTESEINRELRQINKFLNSQTSTLSGYKKVKKKKEEATKSYIEEKFGKKPSKKQYDKIIGLAENRNIWEYIASLLTSERLFEIISNASEKQINEIERIFSLVYEENGKFYIHPNLIKTIDEVNWFNDFFDGNIVINVKIPEVQEDETQDVLYE